MGFHPDHLQFLARFASPFFQGVYSGHLVSWSEQAQVSLDTSCRFALSSGASRYC